MGLFLKQLEVNKKVLPNLLKSRLGTSFLEITPRLCCRQIFGAGTGAERHPSDCRRCHWDRA